jgi:2-desacetyl-2-hydroxyethyl bacteriochlorophyllide A dehydrogenase
LQDIGTLFTLAAPTTREEDRQVPRALVLEGPRSLSLRDEETPDLGPRDVRVRALVSGVSLGTELSLYRGSSAFAEREFDRDLRAFVRPDPPRALYPAPLGYEMVGRVEAVGDAVNELRPGDLVHAGAPHSEVAVLDLDAQARASYPIVKLPATEPPPWALFVALGAVALVAVHDARLKLGDHVAVVGMGAIGLLTVQMARLAGATHISAVDPVESRRQLAVRLGAHAAIDPGAEEDGAGAAIKRAGRGVDTAIETSGSAAGLHDAVAAVALGGTVVTVGFYQGGAPQLRLGEEWHHNRLDMVSSMGAWGAPHRSGPGWDRARVMRTVVDLLHAGVLRVDELPVRRFTFEQAVEAYAWLDQNPREAVKVALTYNGSDPEGGVQ